MRDGRLVFSQTDSASFSPIHQPPPPRCGLRESPRESRGMTTASGPRRPRSALALALISSLAIVAAAACGGGGTGGSTSNSSSAPASKCGLGNGQKATGTPLTLGAIVTKQPGTDFTGITGMSQAYFSCVNDNGGINGRPVKYIVENEQTDPQQVAALATKLIDDDKVLAIVGSTSLIDCPVNHTLYEQRGFNVIVAGVPFACFSTPNIAAVNMGPYYSSEGAAQYLVRQGVKTMVVAGANVPGGDHDISGVTAIAKANNIPSKGAFLENVPISDASGIAVQLTQAAGDGGGVVLNFTPPEGLKILQAAEQQGLVDKVKWAWSTRPGPTTSCTRRSPSSTRRRSRSAASARWASWPRTSSRTRCSASRPTSSRPRASTPRSGRSRTSRRTSSASRGTTATCRSTCPTTRTARSCRRTTCSSRRRAASTSLRCPATTWTRSGIRRSRRA